MHVLGWFNGNYILFVFWILNYWHWFGWAFQNFSTRGGLETNFANNTCNSASATGVYKKHQILRRPARKNQMSWQHHLQKAVLQATKSDTWTKRNIKFRTIIFTESFSHTQSFIANSYFNWIKSVLVILAEMNNWPHYLYDCQCAYHSLQSSQQCSCQ